MNDDTIRKGDLVAIVRGHECALGDVFRVGELVGGSEFWVEFRCPDCGWTEHVNVPCAMEDDGGAPLWWLQKIRPFAEPESLTEHEEALA